MQARPQTQQTPQCQSTDLTLSLKGHWKLKKWPFETQSEAALAAPTLDDSAWATVAQPGKVFYADPDAEGKPIPNWSRVTLTHIDPDDGALLRRSVHVPEEWAGKRVILRFDAVFPAARFFINGHSLGDHMSGLTPVEFDVTDLVNPGADAVVAVRLIRRHKFVQMDMVRHALEFAGLAQPAYLFAVERCHVADYYLRSELDTDLTRGTLSGSITVRNSVEQDMSAEVTVRVVDDAGGSVGETVGTATVPAGESTDLPVSITIDHPELWNDEYPTLYQVVLGMLRASHASGKAYAQPPRKIVYRTGFRRLELHPNGAFLNGRPVKFRGVNHLTFHPEHGMYTPEDWLRQNLTLMKRANVNAIRTHFLGPRCLADLCDELGLFLVQELPVDWGTDYIHDPEWMPPALMRIESGVRRDRHHPSVMIWSVGNENMPKTPEIAEAGWHHLHQFEGLVNQLDPSRPTMFPPPGPANAIDGIIELRVGDVADTHYSFNLIKRFLKEGIVENPNSWAGDMVQTTREQALERGWSGVWFSSEYGIFNAIPDLLYHPYGSVISDVPEDALSGKCSLQAFEERLRREWGFMREEPTCLGGAYFPWLCAGAGSADGGNPWGWVRWAESADWGVVTADLLPKPFFWAMRVLFSPVWFPQRLLWNKGDTEIRFTVHNQYNAIDLQDCTLRVQQNGGGRYTTIMSRFADVDISCPPGAKTEVCIPLEKGPLDSLDGGKHALVRCSLLDPSGFRPITADIIVVPETIAAGDIDATMTVGPDAVMEPLE
ncbi:MAG: hypothetical protein K9N51_12905 [Candidatus Pacebacteria bacterium]|nr:hypothetical protein [Candidatus Paceibacterota bacterium]